MSMRSSFLHLDSADAQTMNKNGMKYLDLESKNITRTMYKLKDENKYEG